MDILVRSWQDLGTILGKIVARCCHGIHFAMVRPYQESHFPKKNFSVKSYFARKKMRNEVNKNQHLAALQCYSWQFSVSNV